MILRFINSENGNCINMDTTCEEHSEGKVAGKNYIPVSNEDYYRISAELDFNCYAYCDALRCDAPALELPLF